MIVGLSSSNGLIRGYKLPFLQYDTSRKLNEAQDIKNRNFSKDHHCIYFNDNNTRTQVREDIKIRTSTSTVTPLVVRDPATMPSQDVDSIRVTHTYPPNNLRLLQLPPELIEELSVDKSQPYVLPESTMPYNSGCELDI